MVLTELNSRNAKDNSVDAKNDANLRYEYDDHYFMTDPEVSRFSGRKKLEPVSRIMKVFVRYN